jgi:hypothetical protein
MISCWQGYYIHKYYYSQTKSLRHGKPIVHHRSNPGNSMVVRLFCLSCIQWFNSYTVSSGSYHLPAKITWWRQDCISRWSSKPGVAFSNAWLCIY